MSKQVFQPFLRSWAIESPESPDRTGLQMSSWDAPKLPDRRFHNRIKFIDLNILETTVLALNSQFWKIHENSMTFLYSDIRQKISKIEIQNSKITICSIQEAPKLHLKSLRRNWLVYSDDIRGLKFENSKKNLKFWSWTWIIMFQNDVISHDSYELRIRNWGSRT